MLENWKKPVENLVAQKNRYFLSILFFFFSSNINNQIQENGKVFVIYISRTFTTYF